MSKNVNVLAVMDDYPDLLDFAAIHYGAWASDCKGAYIASPHVIESLARTRKARAAVAELIEAVDKHLFAIRQMDEAMSDGINVQGAVSAAIGTEEMLRFALSRVKGA